MYTIYADDSLIYSPNGEDMCLYDIVLTLEDNSAGTLSFNITSDHFAFGRLQKLATRIAVQDSERIIWKGRIVADDSNIDNIKTIQCEGQLAFLNDSIFPAFDFSARITAPTTSGPAQGPRPTSSIPRIKLSFRFGFSSF